MGADMARSLSSWLMGAGCALVMGYFADFFGILTGCG
jgi:hypothetical protein